MLLAGVAIAAITSVTGVSSATVSLAHENGTNVDSESPAAPQVGRASSLIQVWVEQHPDSGFAGVWVNEDALLLRWKGEVPDAFSPTLAEARELVRVEVVDAPFTASEIDAKARAVSKLATEMGFTLNTIGPNEDYSFLVSGVSREDLARVEQELGPRTEELEPRELSVKFVPDDTQYIPASRRSDSSPFWGGNAMKQDGTSLTCSSGCSVAFYGSDVEGMVTARHCGASKAFNSYGSGDRIGTAGSGDTSIDAMVIYHRNYSPHIYTGAWNSGDFSIVMGGTNPAPVATGSDPANNEAVCTSGGFEGRHCFDVHVESTGQYVQVTGVGQVGPGFWISNRDKSDSQAHPIGGKGDSGSPVFAWYDSDHQEVSIRGMFDAIPETPKLRCAGSLPDMPLRQCNYRAFIVNVSAIKNQLDVHLLHH